MTVRRVNIDIKDLSHRYSAKSLITFEKINIQAQPGEALAIIGRSGCGKSTLLHIVAGIIRPVDGTVMLDNTVVKAPIDPGSVL